MKEFRPAKKRVEVSVGSLSVILRELQELSQSQLSSTGIPQATISAIENGRVNSGVERVRLRLLSQCHPAVLVISRLGDST